MALSAAVADGEQEAKSSAKNDQNYRKTAIFHRRSRSKEVWVKRRIFKKIKAIKCFEEEFEPS